MMLKRVSKRLRALVRRDRLEHELDEELRYHFERQVDENVASGMTAAEARSAARRSFDGMQQSREACRDARGVRAVDELTQDLRLGLRMLRKHPAFTVVAALSLALGIGGNAAMFSLINSALIRPVPYAEPDQLVRVTEAYPKGGIAVLEEESRTMDVAAYLSDSEFNLTGAGEAAHLTGSVVSANLFALLGAPARVGRTFEPGEDRPGRDRVVVLSHALWQNRFAGDPAIVGRLVTIDGTAREVVGVMPPEFGFPSTRVQIWLPARFDPTQAGAYWEHGWMLLIARLRPGATVPQAQTELRALISRIVATAPFPMSANWNASSTILPLQADMASGLRDKLLLLLLAVGCVLLIACTNLVSLLLARTAARQREMAVRAALGAGRGRIVRQLVTESVVLAFLGGGLGLALAASSLSALKSLLPADNPLVGTATIDWQVLTFLAALALLTGLALGVAPALSATRTNLAAAFRARGQGAGLTGLRLRSSFIVAEVALAVVLVVSAGLLIQSLWRLTQVDPGFRPEQLVTVRVYPHESADQDGAATVALYDELVGRAREISGVADVAAVNSVPLSHEIPILPVEMEGHPFTPGQQTATLLWAGAVTPDYLRIMNIPLLAGRALTAADSAEASRVVLVSAATARKFWPGDDPVGKHVRVVWEQEPRSVVGVVGDVRQYDLSGTSPDYISGAFYMPYAQSTSLDRRPPLAMTLVLRTATETSGESVAAALRRLVASVNPDVPVGDVREMRSVVEVSTSASRSLMWLFVVFGGSALLLAAIGAYGVISYSTTQRTYEMGVRIALGASYGSIFGLVIGQSLKLVSIGLILGIGASLALSRLIAGFLYGVTATDPATFLGVGLLLVVTGLLAGYFPARRAARIDPIVALRSE
jgi:predicted permease